MALNLNCLFFRGGYMVETLQLNVGFHPRIFEDSNYLQVEI
jgi:hypothetical protein